MDTAKLTTKSRDAVSAALRETEEEIGLARRHVELIGALPDYFTGTGFRVTPVVGVVHPPLELTLDAFEVAEAFEVPLAHFLDPRNHQVKSHRVALGQYGDADVPVLEGVSASDWVVAAGGHLLREGQIVAPVDGNNRPVMATSTAAKPE